MKIKAIRKSGYPVNLEEKDAMINEWRETFDRAFQKCKVKDSDKIPDQLRLQKLLGRLERVIGNKYSTVVDWDLIKSDEEWKNKVTEYGNIMVTTHTGTGELLYVIMDEEDVRY